MIQSNNQTLFSTTMIGLILLNPPHPATPPPSIPPKKSYKEGFLPFNGGGGVQS